jgi:tetratricopeptide (TPR) repeat protein
MLKRLRMWTDPDATLRRECVVAILAVCTLTLGACSPQPPALPPVEPSPFVQADAWFNSGDFAAAANAYRRALSVAEPPIDVDREQALFRLALIYALPESPVEDLVQAQALLNQLLAQYPETARAIEIRTLLDLRETVRDLSATIDALRSNLNLVEAGRTAQTETIGQLNSQLEQLRLQLEATETELGKLREIDLGRLPRE